MCSIMLRDLKAVSAPHLSKLIELINQNISLLAYSLGYTSVVTVMFILSVDMF